MIYFKIFTFNPVGVNTLVLWDETRECVIVDAGCSNGDEEQQLLSFINEKELTPVRLLNTHGHFDHIMGNAFVARKWNLEVEAHSNEAELMDKSRDHALMFGMQVEPAPAPGKYLAEGDVIKFGTSELKVIEVPGHSPGGLAFYDAAGGILFPGDILFNSSIGRTDLPGGNHELLIQGIRQKLMTLPDSVRVIPGHGPETTIANEKEYNPFLQ